MNNVWLVVLVLLMFCCSVLQAEDAKKSDVEQLMMSDMYQVSAPGNDVAVYGAITLGAPFDKSGHDYGGSYSFANFDSEEPVKVKIRSTRDLSNVAVHPVRDGVALRHVDKNTIELDLPGAVKLSIEPDGKHSPLFLFVNAPEKNVPQAGDENVVYFGAGFHDAGGIELASNQTLYLAPGAVVKGGVLAKGENIRICGRGILDGTDYPWRKGPTPYTLGILGKNIHVEGITIRGSSHWTVVPRHSSNVTIENVKICGGRVQNDDGINPCNSQDVTIRDCFIRTDDDCVALKGMNFDGKNNNVERIAVENCILWCDRARIFLLGHESRADYMRDVNIRNVDILYFRMAPFLFEPGEEMRLENVVVEDVRLWNYDDAQKPVEGARDFIRLKPVVNQYMRNKVPGHIKDIVFRNVALDDPEDVYGIKLSAPDAEHRVENVTFENVTIQGKPLDTDYANLLIEDYVDHVTITPVRRKEE